MIESVVVAKLGSGFIVTDLFFLLNAIRCDLTEKKIGGKIRKQITCSKLVARAKIIAPLLAHRKRKSKETFKSKFFCENTLWQYI